MSRLLAFTVPRGLRRLLAHPQYGFVLEPVAIRTIPTGELRVRREPLLVPLGVSSPELAGESPVLKVENPIERFFPVLDGAQDRRLENTPHVALLREYMRTGTPDYDNDYTRLQRVRAQLLGRQISIESVKLKVDRLVGTYESIRRLGYARFLYVRRRVVVFERPIHPPLGSYQPQNWEILDGHHRAAALVCLDVSQVKVLVVRGVRVMEYDLTHDVPWDESYWDGAPLAVPPSNPGPLEEDS